MTVTKGWRQVRTAMIAGDAVSILMVYIAADILRCKTWMGGVDWPELIGGRVSSVRVHLKVMAFLPFAWPLILHWMGWYQERARSARWVIQGGAAASAIVALLMASLALLFERELYPRAQIGFTAALLPATAAAWRGISLWLGHRLSLRQPRRVLIIGTGREALRLRRLLRALRWGKQEIVGHLRVPWEGAGPTADAPSPGEGPPPESTGPATSRKIERIPESQVLGDITALAGILDRHVVDEVVFATDLAELPRLMPFVAQCEEVGVPAHVQMDTTRCVSTPEIGDLHGVPMLTFSGARHSPESLLVKRAVDVVVAMIGIIVTAPIMLACAAAIKATSPGPVTFRQRRAGLNGRPFWMFKFRTMVAGAEDLLADVAHLNESAGPVFKSTRDPRITRVGAFLRRWSLDELPQLFNVVKGDMSVVGPRPPIPAEVARYDRWQRRRLSMRPGLTCLWQVEGRHRVGFDDWMQLDMFYIDHWSLKLDFLIMCKTVAVVLSGSGA